MNDLMVFNYEEKEVRTVTIDGEPWWVLKDVCEVLDLGSPHKVAERLDDDEKGAEFNSYPWWVARNDHNQRKRTIRRDNPFRQTQRQKIPQMDYK